MLFPAVLLLAFSGVPNFSYVLQSSTNLLSGQGWVSIATNTAPKSGLLAFTNNPSSGTTYYRLQVP